MKNSLLSLSLLLIFLPPCAAQTTHHPSRTHPSVRRVVTPAASVRRTASPPVLDTVSPAGGRPFSDVPKDHWAAAAVETLRQRGIVKGYPASK